MLVRRGNQGMNPMGGDFYTDVQRGLRGILPEDPAFWGEDDSDESRNPNDVVDPTSEEGDDGEHEGNNINKSNVVADDVKVVQAEEARRIAEIRADFLHKGKLTRDKVSYPDGWSSDNQVINDEAIEPASGEAIEPEFILSGQGNHERVGLRKSVGTVEIYGGDYNGMPGNVEEKRKFTSEKRGRSLRGKR